MTPSENLVILLGRLGKDPEYFNSTAGKTIGKFSLATEESWKDSSGEYQSRTTWHDIVAFGGLADAMKKCNLSKGHQAYLTGKIKKDKYTDKDGVERVSVQVEAQTMRFLTPKDKSAAPSAGEPPF